MLKSEWQAHKAKLDVDPNISLAKSILAQACALELEEISDDAAIGNLTRWDSLAHLRLITSIETINGGTLDAEKMVSLSNIQDIAECLSHGEKKIWLIGDGRRNNLDFQDN